MIKILFRGFRFRFLAVGAILASFASAAHAQSCALCYTQAASAGAHIIQALRSGILVLVIPPAFLSVGITVMAYRKRNQFIDPQSPAGTERNW